MGIPGNRDAVVAVLTGWKRVICAVDWQTEI
jgi:hypothetical protein